MRISGAGSRKKKNNFVYIIKSIKMVPRINSVAHINKIPNEGEKRYRTQTRISVSFPKTFSNQSKRYFSKAEFRRFFVNQCLVSSVLIGSVITRHYPIVAFRTTIINTNKSLKIISLTSSSYGAKFSIQETPPLCWLRDNTWEGLNFLRRLPPANTDGIRFKEINVEIIFIFRLS